MKKLFSSILVIVLMLAAAGCQTTGNPNENKSIVVTYAIMGSLVKDLVGEQAEVTVLIPNGMDMHEWEPSAKDIEKVNQADFIVRNGLHLESGLDDALDNAAEKGIKVFTASDYIQIRHSIEEEHEEEENHGEDAHEHDHSAGDPHLWTDPHLLIQVVEALATELNSDFGWDLSARADDLATRLDALDTSIALKTGAIPEEQRLLVTGHESMGYYADRYGFELIGMIIPGLSSQSAVTAANLVELKAAIEEHSVKVIFTEVGTS
jgi:zinc/manganese transport system substrate-binding protein